VHQHKHLPKQPHLSEPLPDLLPSTGAVRGASLRRGRATGALVVGAALPLALAPAYMCVYVHVSECMCLSACLCVCVCVSVCVRVCARVCDYMQVNAMCGCVCACVCGCVCMRTHTHVACMCS